MKEQDIRPKEIFQQYLNLSKEDAINFFSNVKRLSIMCPACNSTASETVFLKEGFDYCLCKDCGSLYQSPRPPMETFKQFYINSPSSNFWAKEFFPKVLEARREKIFKPRCKRIEELCAQAKFIPEIIADVGAGMGVFLEEMQRLQPCASFVAIEPSQEMAAVCRQKGFNVIETLVEEVPDEFQSFVDLAVCFEVIEHVYSPKDFLMSISKIIKPGGRILITGLGGDGFDIKVLWQNSNNISPPHHLNFLSIKGFEILFKEAGFNNIQIFTPGELDTDIVLNKLMETPISLSRFEKLLLSKGEHCLRDFQKFISEHQLSSHAWIWAEKI